jgi:hypothetical protein
MCERDSLASGSGAGRRHCCDELRSQVEHTCKQHRDPFNCPDHLIQYSSRFDEYGIVVHDGGSSYVVIRYCPWCGSCMPESKRERWFEELQAMGFDDPLQQDIPEEYRSDAWYRSRSS